MSPLGKRLPWPPYLKQTPISHPLLALLYLPPPNSPDITSSPHLFIASIGFSLPLLVHTVPDCRNCIVFTNMSSKPGTSQMLRKQLLSAWQNEGIWPPHSQWSSQGSGQEELVQDHNADSCVIDPESAMSPDPQREASGIQGMAPSLTNPPEWILDIKSAKTLSWMFSI